MTAAKFKPFMFSAWGFALSNIAYKKDYFEDATRGTI
jgi:hypothetical protein